MTRAPGRDTNLALALQERVSAILEEARTTYDLWRRVADLGAPAPGDPPLAHALRNTLKTELSRREARDEERLYMLVEEALITGDLRPYWEARELFANTSPDVTGRLFPLEPDVDDFGPPADPEVTDDDYQKARAIIRARIAEIEEASPTGSMFVALAIIEEAITREQSAMQKPLIYALQAERRRQTRNERNLLRTRLALALSEGRSFTRFLECRSAAAELTAEDWTRLFSRHGNMKPPAIRTSNGAPIHRSAIASANGLRAVQEAAPSATPPKIEAAARFAPPAAVIGVAAPPPPPAEPEGDERTAAVTAEPVAAAPDAEIDIPVHELFTADDDAEAGADDESEADDDPTIDPTIGAGMPAAAVAALLAEIGSRMGLRVWVGPAIRDEVDSRWSGEQAAIAGDLPLNYDDVTMRSFEQLDVIWLKGRAIKRAFVVDAGQPIHSGISRIADIFALQPNLDAPFYVVAPSTLRNQVALEMRRPLYMALDRGPLAESCSFLAYERVRELAAEPHLAHLSDSVLGEYAAAIEV